ncbi:hypothetical protein AALF16_09080 [Bacillus cereus]
MELVFTSTYVSWLNQVECHFGPLQKFVLEGSNYVDPSVFALKKWEQTLQ